MAIFHFRVNGENELNCVRVVNEYISVKPSETQSKKNNKRGDNAETADEGDVRGGVGVSSGRRAARRPGGRRRPVRVGRSRGSGRSRDRGRAPGPRPASPCAPPPGRICWPPGTPTSATSTNRRRTDLTIKENPVQDSAGFHEIDVGWFECYQIITHETADRSRVYPKGGRFRCFNQVLLLSRGRFHRFLRLISILF